MHPLILQTSLTTRILPSVLPLLSPNIISDISGDISVTDVLTYFYPGGMMLTCVQGCGEAEDMMEYVILVLDCEREAKSSPKPNPSPPASPQANTLRRTHLLVPILPSPAIPLTATPPALRCRKESGVGQEDGRSSESMEREEVDGNIRHAWVGRDWMGRWW
ncbi:hypothetical protein BDQ17DRAFT_1422307 [Cyathus striatus]|nr:hypothetical protein BDQ17DRAFT_1422307 [Cyathus striatus]